MSDLGSIRLITALPASPGRRVAEYQSEVLCTVNEKSTQLRPGLLLRAVVGVPAVPLYHSIEPTLTSLLPAWPENQPC